MPKKGELLTVRLTKEEIQGFGEYAKRRGVTMSELVRKFVQSSLQKLAREKKQEGK